ncbi:outer membrane beta-barrel protein [Caballeronia zhejiangensis]|uniref:outer membrane beta-barrel protein n=1 Tax=Caballeronia zhejiangensis TaxID=871203 RepID=UPI001F52241F|nr:outer membrane beta-barrel protein [Caballeronia zhejiangensis]MCI1047019.1 outer membrane beta-barrel protein [Caballeronia zhejiangensis]
MKNKKLILSSITLSVTAMSASCQTVSGWYVAPTLSLTINTPHRQDHLGEAVGLAIGKVLNDQWNIELAGQVANFGAHDRQGNIGLDALYFLNRNRSFAPYATLGMGYVHEGGAPKHESGDYQNLMLRGGLGFTTKIMQRVDLRMDARYQWHGATSGGPRLGDWFISAGINYSF